MDSVKRLAEDERMVIPRVYREALKLDTDVLERLVRDYGGRRAKRLFTPLLERAKTQENI